MVQVKLSKYHNLSSFWGPSLWGDDWRVLVLPERRYHLNSGLSNQQTSSLLLDRSKISSSYCPSTLLLEPGLGSVKIAHISTRLCKKCKNVRYHLDIAEPYTTVKALPEALLLTAIDDCGSIVNFNESHSKQEKK